MKVTNWRRKLAATLVAGGLISPAVAYAAALNTNLVTNGNFENVNVNVFGEYGGPLILNWTGPNLYAYSHDDSTTAGSGQLNPNDPPNNYPATVPDYADPQGTAGNPFLGDPPNAGHWYFTSNNTNEPSENADTDMNTPGAYFQDIDVSTGPTGLAIGEGRGRADLSAYMSSYLNQADFGNVRVEFRDNVGASLGFTQISDSDPGANNVWNLNNGSGPIPVGTTTLRVSLFGTADAGGADGYMDNVDVKVNQTALPQFLVLEINTLNGQAAIKNQTGQAIPIDYYEITSNNGSLKINWNSLQDQNRPDFPAGNGSGNGWEEIGGITTKIVGDEKLVSSSSVSINANISMGQLFTVGAMQDVKFRYAVVAEDIPDSDFNGSGSSEGSDFLIWQRNFGRTTGGSKPLGSADGDADVDTADFNIWKSEFGAGSFDNPGVLLTGAVKYVTTGPTVGVPEPGSVVLVGIGLGALSFVRSRGRNLG